MGLRRAHARRGWRSVETRAGDLDPAGVPIEPSPTTGGPGAGPPERLAAAILAAMSEVVVVVDADGAVSWVSPSVRSRFGYEPDALVGVPAWEYVHPEDVELLAERWFAAAGREPKGVPTRVRVRHDDGRWLVVEARATARLDDPEVAGTIVLLSDITDRATVEEQLIQLAELTDAIARGAPLDVTLQRMTQMVEAALPGTLAGVALADADGELRLRSAPRVPPALVAFHDEVIPDAPAARRLREHDDGAVVYALDGPGTPPEIRAVCDEIGVARVHATPIRLPASGELVGSLSVFHPAGAAATAEHAHPSEREFLHRLSRLAGIAIERDRLERALEHSARYDPLTGLPNRTMLVERVRAGLDRARRRGTGVAVLLLDLDRFKVINDSVGHHHGDEVLRQVADRLARSVRPGDTLGRFGGDELLVVCNRADRGVAEQVASRLLSALVEPFTLGDADLHVTASIGIAVADPDHPDGDLSAEGLVRRADVALHRAKSQGRRQYVVFDPTTDAAAVEQLGLEQALRDGLERGEFVLHVQPVVDLRNGSMMRVEALVRWNRPGHGLVPPSVFIPLAEETGFIIPLGWWVLREACRHAAAWPRLPDGSEVEVAVNLSARQLAAADLLQVVEQTLSATGLDPGRLCFEVTESALVHDVETARSAIAGLKALGVRIAIDDFGTGYATLDYVRHFSMADYLKIDRSFVQGVERPGSEEEAIVSAAIALARSLGFVAVAEGVETERQRVALVDLECDLAQGFLFSRPLEVAEAVALLGRGS